MTFVPSPCRPFQVRLSAANQLRYPAFVFRPLNQGLKRGATRCKAMLVCAAGSEAGRRRQGRSARPGRSSRTQSTPSQSMRLIGIAKTWRCGSNRINSAERIFMRGEIAMIARAVFALALLTCAGCAYAATADELVARNVAARGGMDKLQAIKTLKMQGQLIAGGGFKLSYTELYKRPDKIREEASVQGLTQV